MINETFKNNLDSIGVELTDRQYEQFDMYYKLLVEWNSFMNLTGITDYEEVLLKHYVDSLVLDIEKIGHKEKLSLMYEEMKKSDIKRKRFLLLMLEQVLVFRGFR